MIRRRTTALVRAVVLSGSAGWDARAGVAQPAEHLLPRRGRRFETYRPLPLGLLGVVSGALRLVGLVTTLAGNLIHLLLLVAPTVLVDNRIAGRVSLITNLVRCPDRRIPPSGHGCWIGGFGHYSQGLRAW